MTPIRDHQETGAEDVPLLTLFLQRLNVARRKLSLYPPEHPQIADSIDQALQILTELLHSTTATTLSLGISPRALYYEQIWLDPEDSANRECAGDLSALGIAGLRFHSGVSSGELIRFCQLLRGDRLTIEAEGGFATLLEQQQISHIEVQAVDYSAFQARRANRPDAQQDDHLWEAFLTGLQQGTLDIGDGFEAIDSDAVINYLNQTLCAGGSSYARSSDALDRFMEHRISGSRSDPQTDRRLHSLLEKLDPEAREQLFRIMFRSLDRHHGQAPQFLEKVPAPLLEEAVEQQRRNPGDISSRLLNLAAQLSRDTEGRVSGAGQQLDDDMLKARLDVLFSEEQQDLYMPSSYQQALQGLASARLAGGIPDDERQVLKQELEEHSVERSCAEVIFELLEGALDLDQEDAIQLNLLELSRHFLLKRDFRFLLQIHQGWAEYLDSGNATVNILDEKVLANHAQPAFTAEVLDQYETAADNDLRQSIRTYIQSVGEAYTEPLIERLALAEDRHQRQSWMELLEQLAGDTQTAMLAALNDERWYLVRNLVILLSRDLDPQVIKALQNLADHPHHQVRIEVLRALFACNPATANRLLLEELRSDDPATRCAALEIVDLSRDRGVLDLLHRYLENDQDPQSNLHFKEQLVGALTRIGNPDSLPVLRRVLLKKSLLPSAPIRQVQKTIIASLANFPGTSAQRLLQEMHQGRYRRWAAESLERRPQGSP